MRKSNGERGNKTRKIVKEEKTKERRNEGETEEEEEGEREEGKRKGIRTKQEIPDAHPRGHTE